MTKLSALLHPGGKTISKTSLGNPGVDEITGGGLPTGRPTLVCGSAGMLERYTIEIIDLLESPQRARTDQIVAIPTLVRMLPPPIRKIIGDLSNTERVLVGIDLRPGP